MTILSSPNYSDTDLSILSQIPDANEFLADLVVEFVLFSTLVTSAMSLTSTSFGWSCYSYSQHQSEWCGQITKALNDLSIEIGKTYKDLDISYWFWFRLVFHSLNFLVFYLSSFSKHDWNWYRRGFSCTNLIVVNPQLL